MGKENNNVNNNIHKVVAVSMLGSDIVSYKLENGQILNESEAVQMCLNGQLQDCIVSSNRGGMYIKSAPDGDPTNNLRDLPKF